MINDVHISQELKDAIVTFYRSRSGKYGPLAAEFKRWVQENLRYSVDLTCGHCVWTWTEKAYDLLYKKGLIDDKE